jgi:HEAT repeat protein
MDAGTSSKPRGRGFPNRGHGVIVASLLVAAVIWWWTTLKRSPQSETEIQLSEIFDDLRRTERNDSRPFIWLARLETWPAPFPRVASAILGDPDYRGAYDIEQLGEPAIPLLMEAVASDGSPAVRTTVIEALASLEAYEAVPLIIERLLDDRSPEVRETAARAFRWELQDASAVPSLLEALSEDREPSVRAAAAAALDEPDDGEVVAGLIHALNEDKDATVRTAAADALGGPTRPEALVALTRAARSDASVEVRTAAVRALAWSGLPEALQPVLDALRESEAREVRLAAAESLASLENTNAIPALLPVMAGDPDDEIRGAAAVSVAALRGNGVASAMVAAFKSEQAAVARVRMMEALWRLDEPVARDTFVGAMREDPATEVRRAALEQFRYASGARWALPFVIEVLQGDPEPDLRRQAAEALAAIGGPEIVEALTNSLRSESSSEIRQGAALALGSSGTNTALPLLIALATASDTDKGLRSSAAQALGELGFIEALPPLLATLKEVSKNPSLPEPAGMETRSVTYPMGLPPFNRYQFYSLRDAPAGAIDSLLARGYTRRGALTPAQQRLMEEARAALLEILRGNYDGEAREAAARSLGFCGDATTADTLMTLLAEGESLSLAPAILEGLARLGDPRVFSAVTNVLGRDPETTAQAIQTLARLGVREGAPLLVPHLDSGRPAQRASVARALGLLGGPGQVPALSNILSNDRSAEVREACALALGCIGDRQAVEVLIRTLQDRNETVREQAIWALGHIGVKEAVPALLEVLNDTDSRVSFVAAWALVEVGDSSVIPALKRMLDHKDPLVQLGAAASLTFFDCADSCDELKEALGAKDGWQRYAGVMGLVRLGNGEARQILADYDAGSGPVFEALVERAREGSGAGVFAPCLLERDRDLRLYTIHALRFFDDPACLDVLAAACRDPDDEVREQAVLTHRRLLRRHPATIRRSAGR